MPWVRIHDGAMNHPKILALSDKAFRLWIWGLSYSQQHLTDGYIPLRALPARDKRAVSALLDERLWEVASLGFQIHDYLIYNDSKATVAKKRLDAKDRMQAARDRRTGDDRREFDLVRANVPENFPRTSPEVLRRFGLSTETEDSEKEDSDRALLGARAARLLQELYPQWYATFRHGARLRLIANSLAFQDALAVCGTWDDARIAQLAQVFLTTDDEWISRTDRGFRVFATKATWADDRLKQAELQVRT